MDINISQIKMNGRDQFITDLNGMSLYEVLIFAVHLPLFTFIAIFIELCVLDKVILTSIYNLKAASGSTAKTTVFLVEFLTIVVPVVLLLTVFSDFAVISMLCVVSIIFVRILYSVSSPDHWVHYWQLTGDNRMSSSEDSELLQGKHPFITYFRSLTFLATAVSILGVDFHVYPRRFAKTETYGVSLMDLGVGMFIMSTALITKSKPFIKGLQQTLKESIVFIFLGVVRYYCIQQIDYQTHLTEYGVHWNFFITLGLLKPISHIIQSITRNNNLFCGLTLAVANQYLISCFLENYVMSDKPRDSFMDANREGLVSITGFICIHLFGCSINSLTSFTRRHVKLRVLCKLLVLSLIAVMTTYFCDLHFIKISRRLANLPYVMCVVAIASVLLTTSLTVELLATYFLPIQPHLKSKLYYLLTPAILESINYNGLLFFLITNMLTGILNIFVDLYSLKALDSLIILSFYMLSSCTVVFCLYFLKIQFKAKFW